MEMHNWRRLTKLNYVAIKIGNYLPYCRSQQLPQQQRTRKTIPNWIHFEWIPRSVYKVSSVCITSQRNSYRNIVCLVSLFRLSNFVKQAKRKWKRRGGGHFSIDNNKIAIKGSQEKRSWRKSHYFAISGQLRLAVQMALATVRARCLVAQGSN